MFKHRLLNPQKRLFRGFDEVFEVPHSRHTQVRAEDILKVPELKIMADSPEAGVYIVGNDSGSQFFVMGHSEYDADTLAKEYFRDLGKGMNPKIPAHYFPNDDPSQQPRFNWKSHGHLLFSNWLNYFVYQQTPYELKDLTELPSSRLK